MLLVTTFGICRTCVSWAACLRYGGLGNGMVHVRTVPPPMQTESVYFSCFVEWMILSTRSGNECDYMACR